MEQITVSTIVSAPVDVVWKCFNDPADVVQWNNASPDWHTPKAQNDLRTGGTFLYRMEARDGSAGFDFAGVYDEVIPNKEIAYTMGDGRKVRTTFADVDGGTQVTTVFDPETENPIEMQRSGWQSILDNFKKYVEGK